MGKFPIFRPWKLVEFNWIGLNPYFTGLIPVNDVSWQYELSAASILLWIGPNMAPISNVRVKNIMRLEFQVANAPEILGPAGSF